MAIERRGFGGAALMAGRIVAHVATLYAGALGDGRTPWLPGKAFHAFVPANLAPRLARHTGRAAARRSRTRGRSGVSGELAPRAGRAGRLHAEHQVFRL